VFAAETGDVKPDGKPVLVKLVYAGEVPIRRYCKIRAIANPFDPNWKPYFDARSKAKKWNNQRGHGKQVKL
jgi:RNA-directed DNA polymerase